MIFPDHELILVIYGLYAFECLHWLQPKYVAFVRNWTGRWSAVEYDDSSFTLLGRKPYFVNPLPFSPGLIVCSWTRNGEGEVQPHSASAPSILQEGTSEITEEGIERLASLSSPVLSILTSLLATYLLLILPYIALRGYLPLVWRILVFELVTLHFGVLLAWWQVCVGAAHRIPPRAWWPKFMPLLLNPVAAIRAGDTLANLCLEDELSQDMLHVSKCNTP